MSQEWYWAIVAEGAADRVFGRPEHENPYSYECASPQHHAWAAGWELADAYVETRAREECARWLSEAA